MSRIDWSTQRARLGTLPDRVLALELGVTRERVRQARNHYRIPPLSQESRVLVASLRARPLLLGYIPDTHLAKMVGIPLHRIRLLRREFGIPSFQTSKTGRHGYRQTYIKGCRCYACTAANTAVCALYQKRKERKKNVETKA